MYALYAPFFISMNGCFASQVSTLRRSHFRPAIQRMRASQVGGAGCLRVDASDAELVLVSRWDD